MTKFHTDGANLVRDPFDGTEVQRRIVVTPVIEQKYPTARVLAAAFWASYFTLHWLLILGVVERVASTQGTVVYFLLSAIIVTWLTAAHDVIERKKDAS